MNVQAEAWLPQSSGAVSVETLVSHGPAIADLGRFPVCRCEPSFLPGWALPRSSVPDGPSFLWGSALPRSSVPDGPSFLQGSALPRSSVPDGPSFLQGSALPRSSVPDGPSFLWGSALPRSSVPDGPSFLQGSALPRSSVPDGPSFLQGSALPRSSVPGPLFLQGSALPRSSVQSSTQFSPHFPALFGDNAQSSHVSVQSATDVQPPSLTSSIVADRSCGSAACSAIVRRRELHNGLTFPVNSLVSHGPATSSAEQSPLQVSGHLATDPKWSYTQPRASSRIINPAACGSGYNFGNESGAPCLPAGPDPGGSSIDEFARVLVRCQSSRAVTDEERYSGDPFVTTSSFDR